MRKKLWIGLTATIVLVVLTAVTLFTMQSSNTKAQSADGDGIGVPKYWTPPQNSTVASILAQIAASKGQAKNASSSATIPSARSSPTRWLVAIQQLAQQPRRYNRSLSRLVSLSPMA
ncbi:MAG: hypothetical protein E6J34_10195 [Chloroflexi bacterium]|nr:MAG: hypothetical protein E6J34_10195 [Chloroflexota bacterium]